VASELEQIVDLSERAKSIRGFAFEVSLSALGAIVRCSVAGENRLPGFNAVAVQMRHWSRDLEAAVQQLNASIAARVLLITELVRSSRQQALLRAAQERTGNALLISDACRRVAEHHAGLEVQLRGADSDAGEVLAAIEQLGMMASVLSRAALIEAASGASGQRDALTVASKQFATYADAVNDAILALVRIHRGR
jgi:hypothetical protein